MTTTRAYREIPHGEAACTVCDVVYPLNLSKARVGQPTPIRQHRVDGAVCPGSHKPGRRWLEASGLPMWEEMSDLDKGCALLFAWKVHWEGSLPYAREHYPAGYRDDPGLCGLPSDVRCRHALAVTGGHEAVVDRLGGEAHQRLYDLALEVDRS